MDPGSSRSPAGRSAAVRPEPEAGIPVIVADIGWRRMVPRAEALAARAACLAGGAGSVMLAGDALVKRLNHRHRGRNKPTNVLTFPPPDGHRGGDIVLALGVVRREAAAGRKRPAHHLAHLIVHGVLHLQGHDHHGAGEARRMEMAEARLLHRLGVPNPWKRPG